jgi:class 3 adenylate cyclase
VEFAARLVGRAEPGTVLVTGVVRYLAAGAGLSFAECAAGSPGAGLLYALVD